MFLQIENFLTAAEVQAVAETARQAKFIDGRGSKRSDGAEGFANRSCRPAAQ